MFMKENERMQEQFKCFINARHSDISDTFRHNALGLLQRGHLHNGSKVRLESIYDQRISSANGKIGPFNIHSSSRYARKHSEVAAHFWHVVSDRIPESNTDQLSLPYRCAGCIGQCEIMLCLLHRQRSGPTRPIALFWPSVSIWSSLASRMARSITPGDRGRTIRTQTIASFYSRQSTRYALPTKPDITHENQSISGDWKDRTNALIFERAGTQKSADRKKKRRSSNREKGSVEMTGW